MPTIPHSFIDVMNYHTYDQESCSHSPCTSNRNKELFAGTVSAYKELQLKYFKIQTWYITNFQQKVSEKTTKLPENTVPQLGSEGECHLMPICR